MEEPHFLNIQRSYQILFSYAGAEESKECIGNKITGDEHIYSLSWRRDSRQYPYPFQIKFTTKFVKYNEYKALDPTDQEIKHFKKVPFLHIFFINCSTPEEYRSKIRHESQWIIVFDSKNAREKKNRGQVMERIKSDFSSYFSRVIEVYDRASLSVLESTITASILISIETYASMLESFLLYEKQHFTNTNFNLLAYSNGFFILMHFYWSIGLLETVLSQLDDQKLFLDDIVESYSKNGNAYEWGRRDEVFDKFELLSTLMDSKQSVNFNSLIIIPYLRKYILAQQIMTSFAIYFNKSKRAINSDVNENLERLAILKIDISSIILNSLYETIQKINSDINLLSLKIDKFVYNIWIVLIVLECFEFASILTPQMFNSDLGSNNICLLLKIKCDSMKFSWNEMKKRNFKLSKEELDKLPIHGPFFGNEVNLLSKFKDCLTNSEDFQLYMESTFIEAIMEMKKLKYFRNSIYISYKLAEIYKEMDNFEGALKIKVESMKDILFAGECHSAMTKLLLREVIDEIIHFPDKEFYMKELYLFCYYGLNYAQNEEGRKLYQNLLFELPLNDIIDKVEIPSWLKNQIPFKINYNGASNHLLKCTTNKEEEFRFSISTKLPLEILDFKVKIYFRLVNREILASLAKKRFLFLCKFNSEEIVNRFGCLHKGGSNETENKNDTNLISFESTSIDNNECILLPNVANKYSTCLKFSQTGLYMLEYIEIMLKGSLKFIVKNNLLYQGSNESQLLKPLFKNVFVIVDNDPPTINFGEEFEKTSHYLLMAGVVQKIYITLNAGSKSMDESILIIESKSGSEDRLEFLGSDGEWSNNVKINIRKLNATETISVEVQLYLPTARLSFSNWEDPPVTKKILFKWMGSDKTMKIDFKPLINIITTTSIMDNKALFEMEIYRKHGKDFIIQPIDAKFQHLSKDIDTKEDQIDINRLNIDIIENLDIDSVYSIVWLLTNNQKKITTALNSILKYKLTFKYKVLTFDNSSGKYIEIPFERGYQLISEFNFALPAIEYEICAQLLSEQPQSVICRAQSTCEMVLSIRSITRVVETIIVGLDADPSIWKITNKYKQLTIKDSGLGQIAFSIIPLVVGFLPYPNITVFSFNKEHGQPEKMKEIIDNYPQVIGKQICTFSRTKGKQIHVLGQITIENASSTSSLPILNHKSHNRGESNVSSSRSSLRSSARQKLQKFFDK
ncbi:TRAPP II complex, TRAPPC10 family-containing protein [Strongyloides ratti]|uniref:TRAPP II complex, TRAPPC10 family-containing protein n=1 Tax=Strongyloides ratti TaxID=34506 RepID=A0A090L7B3_STRRB|nr:TRAPP II complex, TRAPPC10 family-containing protein [Strongyloides ratti]CEF65617.1 TRAPP II complex, TRAPPC10 family-containing protein [Strongyloides ratti]